MKSIYKAKQFNSNKKSRWKTIDKHDSLKSKCNIHFIINILGKTRKSEANKILKKFQQSQTKQKQIIESQEAIKSNVYIINTKSI